jgi:hypothetical protein
LVRAFYVRNRPHFKAQFIKSLANMIGDEGYVLILSSARPNQCFDQRDTFSSKNPFVLSHPKRAKGNRSGCSNSYLKQLEETIPAYFLQNLQCSRHRMGTFCSLRAVATEIRGGFGIAGDEFGFRRHPVFRHEILLARFQLFH